MEFRYTINHSFIINYGPNQIEVLFICVTAMCTSNLMTSVSHYPIIRHCPSLWFNMIIVTVQKSSSMAVHVMSLPQTATVLPSYLTVGSQVVSVYT